MTDPIKPMHDVDALARRLPRREPRPDRAEAMRRAVLDAAQLPRPWWTGKRVRRGALAVGVMAAAAACAMIALRTVDHHAARVEGTDRIAGEPVVSPANAGPPGGSLPDGRTLLPEGRTTIDATRPVHLTHGEATITAPPGARFDIEVRGDQVKRITVKVGWVVIASARMAATVVAERHTWTPEAPPPEPLPAVPPPPALDTPQQPAAPVTVPPAVRGSHTASATAAPAPPSHDAAPRAPSTPPVVSPSSARTAAATESANPIEAGGRTEAGVTALGSTSAAAIEQEFHSGLRTLLAGNARAATDPLDRACSAASTTQDDICYWAAIAWLRAGDRVHARHSLEDVLANWPRSTHAGEANVALGRLLLDSGDRAGARTRFAAAAEDRVPGVRAEALRGLAAAQ